MAMPALDATSTPASTAFASVLALISSAVGAGVLSFPYAFRSTGWLAGLIAVGAIAAAEGFTLYVVSRMAEYTKQRSYAALVGAGRLLYWAGGACSGGCIYGRSHC